MRAGRVDRIGMSIALVTGSNSSARILGGGAYAGAAASTIILSELAEP